MKFQVSVLSDKGGKKQVLEVLADYFEEENKTTHPKLIFLSSDTRLKFWTSGDGVFASDELVASVLLSGSYVVEQVGL